MMKVEIVAIEGDFALAPSPRNRNKRISVNRVAIEWIANGIRERVELPAGFEYDGASVPGVIRALVWLLRPMRDLIDPFGFAALPSGFHDWCFHARPALHDGIRIGRKYCDVVFLALLRYCAADTFRRAALRQAERVAVAMYVAVRLFGEDTWDRHDDKFREEIS